MTTAHRVELFGVPVDALTMDEAVDRIRGWVTTGIEHQHVSLNAAKVVEMTKNSALAELIGACDLISADGKSVVWASRVLGQPLPERVCGIDLMERLVDAAARDGHSVFFLGARPEVVAKMATVLQERHPGLVIAGYHHGYWQDDEEVIDAIRAAHPDYLFLGIPSPRKEFWLNLHLAELKVPVAIRVGGSFDVVAGLYRRAPRWVGERGLEWMWRLAQEPRRMWRRYLIGNSLFITLVLRERLRRPRPA
jgi:N-acetylglucosaminyldiphosphoundecaprenol N-acetyl-beta-D-mannosaminyltransferase